MKIASVGLRRFSFSAKKSSVAHKTAPPRRSAARSTSSVKSLIRSGSPQPTSAWPSREADAPFVNRLAVEDRAMHDAVQRARLVRRDLVLVLERRRIDGEVGVRIPEDEIGIEPRRDRALARREAGEPR